MKIRHLLIIVAVMALCMYARATSVWLDGVEQAAPGSGGSSSLTNGQVQATNVANDSLGPGQMTSEMRYVTNGPSFSCHVPAATGLWFKIGNQTASSVTKLSTFMVWYNVGSGPPHRILFQAGYSTVGGPTPRLSVIRADSANTTNGFGAVGGDGSGNIYVQITNMSHAAIGTITMDSAGWSDDTPDERPTLTAMTTNPITDVAAATILYMTPGPALTRYPRGNFDSVYLGGISVPGGSGISVTQNLVGVTNVFINGILTSGQNL